MRRRRQAGAAAVFTAIVVGVTGCTSGSGSEDDSGDGKQGGSTTAPAKPGTHASLPEPCGSVSDDALSELLLVDDDKDSGDLEELFKGTAAVTYDIERRVGCEWKSAASLGSHHLKVDFERVVSYDSTVSDDDRASVLYEARARQDEIPAEAPPTEEEEGEESEGEDEDGGGDDSGSDTEEPGSNEPTGNGSSTPAPEEGESDDATPDPAASDDDASSHPGIAPRPLDSIGDVAYLNDELVTADSGLHRDVTLVFRTGNVIVTVEYDQWSNDKRLVPGSEELQEKAQKLAKQLAEQLDS